jgi:hypothetical protein
MSSLAQGLEFITYTNTASVQVTYPLFTASNQTLVYKSIPAKGDGYFGSSDGLHTVMYTYDSNFIGTITMQASLATSPTEADWFNITDTEEQQTEYSSSYSGNTVSAHSSYHNFTGNFVWVRGVVVIEAGQVDSIYYNH